MQESIEQMTSEAVEPLRANVVGEVFTAEDAGYEEVRRLYQSGFDMRPATIVRVADAADIVRVVRYAGDAGLELAVRSGGHSVAGHGSLDGGVVIDLSAMDGIEIDVSARTAWAQTGMTAGAYTSAVGAHGLATGFGDAGSVGIGGITLGGGVGFLHRAYGMTIDSVLAADVVTADGELVRADAKSHPDLFWAIRGGGGNFGVVTRIQYRLHEVPRVLGGMLILPATPEVLRDFLIGADSAPEELSGMMNVMRAPPMPFLPPEVHGHPVIMAVLVWSGEVEAGERALASFRSLAKPIVDDIGAIRYPALYEEAGEPPHPVAMAVRTCFVDELNLAGAEAVLEALDRCTAPMSVAQFRVLGGAVARVPASATAFPHRQRRMIATTAAMFDRPGDRAEHEEWARGLADNLRGGDPSAYIGFLGEDDGDTVRGAYDALTWERLRAVKRRYDPGNLFRRNHNVPPADTPDDR